MFNWLAGLGSFVRWVRIQKDQGILAQTLKAIQQTPSAPGAPPTPTALPTEVAQKQSLLESVRFFMFKGLSKSQAEGVTARLARESGGNLLDPNARNKMSGAYGIAQWLGSRKSAALATHGNLQKQLDLVWKELNTTERKALAAILLTQTPEQAAMAMEMFERACNPSFTLGAARYAGTLAQKFKHNMPALRNAAPLQIRLSMLTPVGLAPLAAAGATTINFSPSTNMNVTGVGPEIGSYVFGAQSRLFADQVRNLTAISR